LQDSAPHIGLPVPDPGALRNCLRRYRYDAAGNIVRIQHAAMPLGNWTRHYDYAADSNRLQRSWTGDDDAQAVDYQHDFHGCMLNLNRSPEDYSTQWDYRDMVRAVNLGGGGRAYYNYDAAKQRSRKVIAALSGEKQWERLYLGEMELYRRFVGGEVTEE